MYIDRDGDGYDNGQQTVCYGNSVPAGYKQSKLGSDCNDANADINPGKAEICGNGIDDKCNGQIDEGCNTAPTISISDVILYESQGTARVTVTLSARSSQALKVNYASMNGTALSSGKNKDYTTVKGTLTIPAGSLTGPDCE